MTQFLIFLVGGLVAGAIYSLFASGLVLIYSSSGIFNLAFGSFAFMAMLANYELSAFMPRAVAILITVVVLAPVSGLLFEQFIFRRLARAPQVARLIGSVGLLLGLPALGLEVTNLISEHYPSLGLRPVQDVYSLPGLGPVPPDIIHLGNGSLTSDQLIALGVGVLLIGALWAMLNLTRMGLMTRAVVDRRELAALRGVNPAMTSRVAWVSGSVLAAFSGLLVGPLYGMNSNTLLGFVVASSAVVVLARFRSLPIAAIGGLLLGAATSLVAGYGSDVPGLRTVFSAVPGTRQAVIYVVLLGALVWRGSQQGRAAGVSQVEPVPEDYLADLPKWRRWWPWVVLGVLATGWATGIFGVGRLTAGPLELKLLWQAVGMSFIFLSFVVVVGMLGVATLAQAAMASAGALVAGVCVGHGFIGGNFVVALVVGAFAAALLGLLVAIPALRLGGLALALATLALGFLADSILFQINQVTNYGTGWTLTRPKLWGIDFANDRSYIGLLAVLLCVCIYFVSNLERARSGRSIYATRFASAAASATGLSNRKAILVAFGVSGALAGLGGVLMAYGAGSAQPNTWPTATGILWLMVVMIQGVRRPASAIVGGFVFAFLPRILSVGIFGLIPNITDPAIPTVLFGLACVGLANQPEGILHGFSAQNYRRRRARRERAENRRLAMTAASVTRGQIVEPPVPSVSNANQAGGSPQKHHKEELRQGSGPSPARLTKIGGSSLLQITNVVAGYNDSEVLHGVNLEVPAGTIVAVLGPNGAGKSTLCGTVAGSVQTFSGEVTFDGKAITQLPAYRRVKLGLLLAPESRGVFPSLSVEENLAVSLPSSTDRDRALERFPQLEERRRLPAANLSGGEQQMLCLAPLLVNPPRLLIADEISLGLAPSIVTSIMTFLGELRDAGTTILMVEEKARNVLNIADYCAFLSLGLITAFGPIAEFSEDIIAESYLGSEPLAQQAAVVGATDVRGNLGIASRVGVRDE